MNTRPWLIFFVCVLAVTGTLFAIKHHSQAQAPMRWSEPMPNPNSFDTCVKASEALVEKRQIADLYYASVKPGGHLADLPAKAALVQQNANALGLLRTGLAGNYRQPPSQTLNDLYPYYAGYRALSRLLVLEAEVKEGQGDMNGALDSYLDGMQLGELAPRGGPIIGTLVGVSLQSIMRRELSPMVQTIDAAQARKVVQRCAECSKLEWEYADVMAEEKNLFQNTLQDAIEHPERYKSIAGMKDLGSFPPQELKSLKASHARVMDEMIRKVRQPYSSDFQVPHADGLINEVFMSELMPTFVDSRIYFLANRVYNRQLTLAFALRAYKLEHNAYPETLQKLVPDYLPDLPADPFARKGTFQYYPQRDMYLLYSLGPDGKDDHGTAYTPPNEFSKWVKQDTQGDIVAGKNDL